MQARKASCCYTTLVLSRKQVGFLLHYFESIHQHMEIVTFMPRLPLSAKSCAIEVSKTRQSELRMAEETPSWMDRGVASHVKRRR